MIASDARVLLEVKDLKKYFPIRKGFLQREIGQVKAVNGVSFVINSGETLGLVGESGCGKTTTGRTIVRAYRPTEGQIIYHANGSMTDLTVLTRIELKPFKRNIQMIFQDPFFSLNPRMIVLEIIGEPLLVNKISSGKELEQRVKSLIDVVGLKVPYLKRYPHAFSGGRRQRIGIARALSINPKLIVADEPVSALDVSIQAQILNLLQDLQEQFHLSYLFIAHDLSVVEHISDRVAVMYVGKLVEMAETQKLFLTPRHPYTEALLSAVPIADPLNEKTHYILPGEMAGPAAARKNDGNLIEIKNLRTFFHLDEGLLKAVDGVYIVIDRAKTVGLVGESGCGKSVTAQSIMRIVPYPGKVEGQILFSPSHNGTGQPIDLVDLPPSGLAMRAIRGTVPIPIDMREQCGFQSRCAEYQKGVCRREAPPLVEAHKGHCVRCFRYQDFRMGE